MKKTILASAILLAGAANAAEIYNNDGATLSLNGSMRAHVAIESSDDVKFENAGSRFNIQATQEVEEGLKAFGKVQIKYKDVVTFSKKDDNNTDVTENELGSEDGLYFNNAYVGLASDDLGTIKLGKFIGINDDLVYNDFTYEGGLYDHQSTSNIGNGTTNQMQYTKGFGDVKVAVSIADQDTYGFGAEFEAAGLSVGFAYDIANDRDRKTGQAGSPLVDNSAYILGAKYTVDALTVGVQFQGTDISDEDYKGYGIGAEYAMGQSRAYAMYDVTDVDGNKDKGSIITLGVDYVLAKGVKTYAEFYSTDTGAKGNSSDENDKLVVGARVYF